MLHRALLFLGIFLASCVIGPALDQIHVVGGALTYADPWLLGQAWWVAPQFGLAFAGLCLLALEVQRRLGTRRPDAVSTPRILQQVAWFVTAYLVTGALHERPWLVFAVLLVGLLVRVAAVRPDVAMVRTLAALAIAGTAYEAVVSSIPGTFDYANVVRDLPVPIWLPLLYAHGAPLLRSFTVNVTRTLHGSDDATRTA